MNIYPAAMRVNNIPTMKGLSKSRYTAYHNLDGSVHNGGEAMTIYPKIAEMLPDEADAARRSLLEYCKLDTLAMVKIWERLKQQAQD